MIDGSMFTGSGKRGIETPMERFESFLMGLIWPPNSGRVNVKVRVSLLSATLMSIVLADGVRWWPTQSGRVAKSHEGVPGRSCGCLGALE